jgi:hypothetical protein
MVLNTAITISPGYFYTACLYTTGTKAVEEVDLHTAQKLA